MAGLRSVVRTPRRSHLDTWKAASLADSDFLGHRPPHPKAFIPGSVSVKKSTISGAPAFASYLPKSFTPNSSVACGVRCGEGKKGAPNLKRVPGSPSGRDDRAATRGALHRRQLGSWYMTGASRDSSSVSRATIPGPEDTDDMQRHHQGT